MKTNGSIAVTVSEAAVTHSKYKLAVGIREAAQMLSVSARTIQNYIAAKLLPALKIGRRTVIRVADLERFLRQDQPSPTTKPTETVPSGPAR